MSDYLDRPVYDDVDDEARSAWADERPEVDRPEDVLDDEELAEYRQHQRVGASPRMRSRRYRR